MEERRCEGRKELRYFTRVNDYTTGRMYGYLANMTTGGAMMVSLRPIDVGTLMHFQIDLPEEYAPQDHLLLNVQAVWCRPEADDEIFKVGLRLLEISPKDLNILIRLLDEYGIEDI